MTKDGRSSLFCFGLGYSAEVLARRLLAKGWQVAGTSRSPERRDRLTAFGIRMVPFDRGCAVPVELLREATHVVSSVAPDAEGDPVVDVHAGDLGQFPGLRWVAYLGSTGVYGNHDGAWVDETSELRAAHERGRRRIEAERAWLRAGLPVHVFRLAGIYGPGRNVLARVRSGTARRIVKPGQFFSRIHVDDIASVLEASIERPAPGRTYNVGDDEPSPATALLEYAATLLGMPPPPAVPYDAADLSTMARSFYEDNRRVSNARIRAELGVRLAYPSYREGLHALAAS